MWRTRPGHCDKCCLNWYNLALLKRTTAPAGTRPRGSSGGIVAATLRTAEDLSAETPASGGAAGTSAPVSSHAASGDGAPVPSMPAPGPAGVEPACGKRAASASPAAACGRAPARLAVFDYDGTIVDGQSGSLFSRYLLQHGLISFHTAVRLGWWGTRYKLHLPYRQDEARELIFRDIGAHGPEEAERIMREFHDEVLSPRYRVDAITEVLRRGEEGCVTLLVSATFDDIARIAAEALGMSGYVATRMELDAQGAFTGRVEGEVIAGEGKCRAVRAWANERLGEGAWRVAYAYGDHFSDEPLLAQAETPFAVCPGKTLRQIARRHGWRALDWK